MGRSQGGNAGVKGRKMAERVPLLTAVNSCSSYFLQPLNLTGLPGAFRVAQPLALSAAPA